MIEQNGYTFDFSKWKMRDVLNFQAHASDMEVLLPMIAKVMIENPLDVDLASPTAIDDIDVVQWAAVQKEFSAALSAVFQ